MAPTNTIEWHSNPGTAMTHWRPVHTTSDGRHRVQVSYARRGIPRCWKVEYQPAGSADFIDVTIRFDGDIAPATEVEALHRAAEHRGLLIRLGIEGF